MSLAVESPTEIVCLTAQKMETADLVTFTEEILNGKLHFFCSAGKLIWLR